MTWFDNTSQDIVFNGSRRELLCVDFWIVQRRHDAIALCHIQRLVYALREAEFLRAFQICCIVVVVVLGNRLTITICLNAQYLSERIEGARAALHRTGLDQNSHRRIKSWLETLILEMGRRDASSHSWRCTLAHLEWPTAQALNETVLALSRVLRGRSFEIVHARGTIVPRGNAAHTYLFSIALDELPADQAKALGEFASAWVGGSSSTLRRHRILALEINHTLVFRK